ncbi:hypothetical protein CHLRE_05g232600v5 [Chlamydomonas reinhardtii]|uniref:Peptidase M11 gametolysin domain-containing protein n=1 Tax=Chlamydomonas reinhardtii TaxID=3055 RepID=A0A2K3DRV8_CHLRE|nr:uncharacterized protein CHLRE_05g232600v5 [Chlamydomonas reinhardtii]PNW83274.1 hypothetical protein CHLRE_05g232600v5 [Chlamydomonas reinhardtii]
MTTLANAAFMPFEGRLLVLNEPRKADKLVASPTFAFYYPDDYFVYQIKWQGVAPPDAFYKTGDAIRLVVDLDASGTIPNPNENPSAGPPGLLVVIAWEPMVFGTPASEPLGQSPLRAAVWVVTSVCGRPVQGGMSVQEVEEIIFGPPPGAAGTSTSTRATALPRTSLSRLLDTCSAGVLAASVYDIFSGGVPAPAGGGAISRAGSIVKALELPCEGYSGTGAAWSARPNSACGWNELWGWLEYARDSTPELGQFGTSDFPRFLRQLLVLPPPTGSGWPVCKAWQQRGSLGCDAGAGCAMWVKADRANLLEWAATQFGASLTLRPAAAGLVAGQRPVAGGDPSDPLGSPEGGYRCFNAPHAYKLGFASAVSTFDATNRAFIESNPTQVLLPASTTNPVNTLVVNPTWPPFPPPAGPPPPQPPVLYGQYRSRLDGDAGLAPSVRERLLLHTLNATLDVSSGALGTQQPSPSPVLVAALQPGQLYRYTAGRVVVKFEGLQPPVNGGASDPAGVVGGVARVTVCGYRFTVESGVEGGCYNGLDDDCDGLVDDQDPDCA